MEPTRFFEKALPTMISRNWEAFVATKGIIQFSVQGHGQWYVRLGGLQEPIQKGAVKNADLRLRFRAQAFEDFIAGKLDPARAIAEKSVGARGDVSLLEVLGNIMQPPMNLLSIRLQR